MEKLMYEEVANIGDTIRGYDWCPSEAGVESYFEGVVFAKGKTKLATNRYGGWHYVYSIKMTKRIIAGKDKTNSRGGLREGRTVYVPFESSDDKYWLEEYHKLGLTGRVEKIRDAE